MNKTLLINKDNPIKQKYLEKLDLIEVKDVIDENIFVDQETYNQFLKLKDYLEQKNIIIGLVSGYRTIEHQQELLEEYKEKYGEEYANKIVAPPTTSEHHTSLALDITIKVDGRWILEEQDDYKYDHIFKEIHKYLHLFGFILRYPESKEEITKYPYEPWHIRYVGEFVSKIIYDKKITLEEYHSSFGTVLFINKEKDMTSFDVVNKVSKLFGIKRVGHTGTLDPLATGVLIVAVGQATKIVELLTSTYKEYIAEVKLGIKTDTLDITGEVLETKEVPKNINLEQTLNSFKKTYLQEVPIYSAVKVNGKKLYEYARNNQEVELPKKEVTIKEIELLSSKEDTFTFKALVSKGCYIRSLINDIGNSLNTYATMTKLNRTKQGIVTIEETNTLEDLDNKNIILHNIEDVLDIEIIEVNEFLENKIRCGHRLNNTFSIKDKVIFKNKNNQLLGIYQVEEEYLKVWKNFI